MEQSLRDFAKEQVVGKGFVGELTITQRAMIDMLVEFGMKILSHRVTQTATVKTSKTPMTVLRESES